MSKLARGAVYLVILGVLAWILIGLANNRAH